MWKNHTSRVATHTVTTYGACSKLVTATATLLQKSTIESSSHLFNSCSSELLAIDNRETRSTKQKEQARKRIIAEQGDWLQESRPHIRFKRQRCTFNKELGSGDTMVQATRQAARRLKGGADTETSRVACRQSRGRELWDLSYGVPKCYTVQFDGKNRREGYN